MNKEIKETVFKWQLWHLPDRRKRKNTCRY
jgi:hypothetical protein